jgi:hypothetical protein
MFEDFQKQMSDASFQDGEKPEESPPENTQSDGYFFGMSPVQRFIVAILLLMMTIILGVLFLLVTSKIAPPFLG